jgi:hypothetical protein
MRDVSAAARLAEKGYAGRTIAAAMRAAGAEMAARERGRREDYISKIVELALERVRQAARELERDGLER